MSDYIIEVLDYRGVAVYVCGSIEVLVYRVVGVDTCMRWSIYVLEYRGFGA